MCILQKLKLLPPVMEMGLATSCWYANTLRPVAVCTVPALSGLCFLSRARVRQQHICNRLRAGCIHITASNAKTSTRTTVIHTSMPNNSLSRMSPAQIGVQDHCTGPRIPLYSVSAMSEAYPRADVAELERTWHLPDAGSCFSSNRVS